MGRFGVEFFDIKSAIRTVAFLREPREDAAVMENMFTWQFSYDISCRKVIWQIKNRTNQEKLLSKVEKGWRNYYCYLKKHQTLFEVGDADRTLLFGWPHDHFLDLFDILIWQMSFFIELHVVVILHLLEFVCLLCSRTLWNEKSNQA